MSMPTWVAEPATPPRLGRRLGPPAQIHHGKVVAQAILHTRLVHGMLDGQFCELRYPSPTTGDDTTRLVRYAVRGTDLVVLAEMADHDQWWRTFTARTLCTSCCAGAGARVWGTRRYWGSRHGGRP